MLPGDFQLYFFGFLLNHALYSTPFEIDKAGEMEAELVLVGAFFCS